MIEVQGLKKSFKVENPKKLSEQERKDPRLQGRYFHSVESVSFSCDKGTVLGLLGPNGAGKTTTLRMLSTALKPEEGKIFIDGEDVLENPVIARKRIGFLSGTTGLYGRLTGRENIAYFGQLHGMQAKEIAERIDYLADLLDLGSFIDRRCEHFSTGMKQKTAIARAVVHSPAVVILDEPTTGLDIIAAQTVLNFIRHLKTLSTPVVFSTHHLEEVSELCDKVCVIHHGKTVFNDSIEAFSTFGEGSLSSAFLSTLEQEG